MAAKGSILKQEISKKILSVFENSFLYNDGKEIRINGTEDGVPIQIKVTLTAAKTPVESDEINFDAEDAASIQPTVAENIPQEPSQEEKERLATLLERLNL